MTDHTYCYTPAVQKMRELVASGELGDIHFVDSVRINLGLVQPDIDVLWDLAPHDLSILDFILPGGLADGRGPRHRRGPDRCGPRVRGPPDPAAGGRRARPRPRQLAQPHQDPPDGHRRLAPHARVGRPQPAAAPQHLRPGRRPRPVRRSPGRTARPRRSPTASATPGRRPCPSARRSARWSPSSPRAIREDRPAAHRRSRRAARARPCSRRRRPRLYGEPALTVPPAPRPAVAEPALEAVR